MKMTSPKTLKQNQLMKQMKKYLKDFRQIYFNTFFKVSLNNENKVNLI